MAEVPLLKSLRKKHGKHNFVIVGISFDEDLAVLGKTVAAKGLNWTHIAEGKGVEESALGRLFNVEGTPMNYLLDREGKIVAKDIPRDELAKVIGEAVKK